MDYLEIKNITKSYGEKLILKNVSLSAKKGEFLALLGSSGCGKTTLLNAISGVVKQDEGQILVNGEDISSLPIEKRNIGMVFQNYALFSHMNVYENVAYGLRLRKYEKNDICQKVEESLEMVRLGGYSKRKTNELSGGEQQRVALARAIVYRPHILLLDEPLSALDKKIREQMQVEIRRIQKETGITTVFVTHDQSEALSMADRVLLMNKGVIEESATPQEIYLNPVSPYAASFIGSSNVFEGIYKNEKVICSDFEIYIGKKDINEGTEVRALIKEEDLTINDNQKKSVQAKVLDTMFHGQAIRLTLESKGMTFYASVPARTTDAYVIGSTVSVFATFASVFER